MNESIKWSLPLSVLLAMIDYLCTARVCCGYSCIATCDNTNNNCKLLARALLCQNSSRLLFPPLSHTLETNVIRVDSSSYVLTTRQVEVEYRDGCSTSPGAIKCLRWLEHLVPPTHIHYQLSFFIDYFAKSSPHSSTQLFSQVLFISTHSVLFQHLSIHTMSLTFSSIIFISVRFAYRGCTLTCGLEPSPAYCPCLSLKDEKDFSRCSVLDFSVSQWNCHPLC